VGELTDEARQPPAGQSAQLVGGDDPLLLGVVRQARPDSDEYLVEGLAGGEFVQTDDEDMSESALVRGVRGAERGVGGGVRAVRERRERFAGQGFGQVGGGQVVRRLVGRGQQGAEVRVGAVVGQTVDPAPAVAAGEQGTGDLSGGCGVEPVEADRGRYRALLFGEGDLAGEAWETGRRQRGSSAWGGGTRAVG
jgi:hypothetical protein